MLSVLMVSLLLLLMLLLMMKGGVVIHLFLLLLHYLHHGRVRRQTQIGDVSTDVLPPMPPQYAQAAARGGSVKWARIILTRRALLLLRGRIIRRGAAFGGGGGFEVGRRSKVMTGSPACSAGSTCGRTTRKCLALRRRCGTQYGAAAQNMG